MARRRIHQAYPRTLRTPAALPVDDERAGVDGWLERHPLAPYAAYLGFLLALAGAFGLVFLGAP